MSGRTTPSATRPPSTSAFASPISLSTSHSANLGAHSGTPHHQYITKLGGTPPTTSSTPLSPTSSSPSSHNAVSTSVKVALRIRPPPPPEASSFIPPRFLRSVVHPSGNNSKTELTVEAITAAGTSSANKSTPRQSFTFDRVLGPDDGQGQVYESVEPLVARFLEGYNVTVLAYGQTSSGKSYTMGTDTLAFSPADTTITPASPTQMGDSARDGIIPRAVNQIFTEITRRNKEEKGKWAVEAKNSYIEIYNEELIDLLAGDLLVSAPSERPAITIREDKAGHILWTGLKEVKVASATDVMKNLADGSAIRQTGQTAMNDQSSRSHAIFSLTLTQRKYTGTVIPTSANSTGIPGTPRTPSRLSHRQSIPALSNIPGLAQSRIASPTPGGSRPGTPSGKGAGAGLGLLPRPSSVMTSRILSPSSKSRDEDDNGSTARPGVPAGDGEWVTVVSKFHWVDLAGSERLKRTSAMGERAKEGISINAGLLALGNVISALGDPVKARHISHIPYRDSKLTRLLQDSLGGNSHTLMIACVSPVEFNVSETLNTLKYANRARNIKNKAELNEIEAGWDDMEHLQQLVTRLRSELAVLKGSAATTTTADETPSPTSTRSSQRPASTEVLRLQAQYSELSARYTKLTAEAAQTTHRAEASHTSPNTSFSTDSFQQAVEPIVEEYERSISAIEFQLSLTKAALTHSEELLREKDDRLNLELAANESSGKIISDLKTRLAKLSERESITEAYIRDLEARISSSNESDKASSAIAADLRKELARYREVGTHSEHYIRDLEARLSKSEEVQRVQKNQIEKLERDIQRREKAYEELEARLELLDTSQQHKELLAELDARDKRLLDTQSELESAKSKLLVLERESKEHQTGAQQNLLEKQQLQIRISDLEQLISSHSASSITPLSLKPASHGLTPPQTPSNEPSTPGPRRDGSPDTNALLSQLQSLQDRHDAAVAELRTLSDKYEDSLKDIENLQTERRERSRKVSGASSVGTSSLSPASDAPSLARSNEDTEELQDAFRPSLLPSNGPYASPTRSSRTRRSIPLSPRGSFLGRSPVTTSSASHLRSLSLSQELSLVHSLNGNMNLPAPLNSPHSIGSSTSPRSASPRLSRHDSLLAMSQMAWTPPERSNESLLKEVKKLQETLNEREEEIRALEVSFEAMRASQQAQSEEQSTPVSEDRTHTVLRTPIRSPPVQPTFDLSPSTLEAFTAIKASFRDNNTSLPSNDPSQDQLGRLDDLMLAMAKKEVSHREAVDDMHEQLRSLQKQYDELKALSKDQVHNMSTEISALREELAVSSSERESAQTQFAAIQQDLRQLTEVHKQELGRQKALGDAVSAKTSEEHQRIFDDMSTKHSFALTELMDGHAKAMGVLQIEHEKAIDSLRREQEKAVALQFEEHSKSLALVQASRATEADEVARVLRSEHEQSITELKSSHSSVLASLTDSHQSTIAELNRHFEDALESQKHAHEVTAQTLRDAHSSEIQSLQNSLIETEETTQSLREALEVAKSVILRLETENASNCQEVEVLQLNCKQSFEMGKEVEELKSSLQEVKQNEEMLSTELQEALDALGTLEKALINSQDERERLMSEIHDLQKQRRVRRQSSFSKMPVDPEKEALRCEVLRLGNMVKQMSEPGESQESQRELGSPPSASDSGNVFGLHLGDSAESREFATETLIRTSSSTSELERYVDAPQAKPQSSSRTSPVANLSTRGLATPPPSTPPPPLPRDALHQSTSVHLQKPTSPEWTTGSMAPPLTGSTSANSQDTRTSINSTFTPESHAGPSVASSYTRNTKSTSVISTDAISVDPRVHQKLEEQDSIIAKLTKRLAHCETELKANIDLVTTLESALNDSERNLRKSRLQMNEIARERDSYNLQNDNLRLQNREKDQKIQSIRQELTLVEEEARQKTEVQEKAQREARFNAEQRMQEIQRLNRKSKFNVGLAKHSISAV